ncbi:Uu.00g103440.m01.CDS01 [Anthostomella pinea]|uniref:Uu.00g103440.m01.CDS01 n=1 Tax=Anthostomella pinea TaxID=933095 RepID=A0AAI8YD71_9PEZI|nr:Uu.00g103440.m01.CDS01 [Anthostomella pinea]
MSQQTPAYYPEGWDRERMLNAGVNDEIGTLTDDQLSVFREGLRADIGDQGFDQFFAEMSNRRNVAKGTAPNPVDVGEPAFMETMRLREERFGGAHRLEQWGFVVFKSPRIRDEAQWDACRQRFEEIVRESTDFYRGYPGLDECLSRLKFQWVEDAGDADGSVASISHAYTSMVPPRGLDHSLCLHITPASLDSILNSPLPSTANRRYRKDIPYVLAVSAHADQYARMAEEEEEEDIAGAGWRGYFNVAVETLLESIFPMVVNDTRSPFEIGGNISGKDVYCDHTRWGVHKAGVGYWDKRTQQAGTGL